MLSSVVMILWALAQSTHLLTHVRIVAVDESGEPLRLSRAAVYLDAWGGGKEVPLTQDERGLSMRLDRAWLCAAWPEACGDLPIEGRLILEVKGYTTATSGSFLWLGGVRSPDASPESSVTIDLGSAGTVQVREGQSKELRVQFRRPARRILRVVDDRSRSIASVAVQASLFLADSNHCGATEGEVLFRGETTSTGQLVIPDVDGECALEFSKAHYVLQRPSHQAFPMRLTGRFSAPVTTVVLRPLERRALRLRVMGDGDPAVGVPLEACVANCGCGACCGNLAQTDGRGQIEVEDFYPEEYDRIMLTGPSGRPLWEGDPRQLPKRGWVTVTIRKR